MYDDFMINLISAYCGFGNWIRYPVCDLPCRGSDQDIESIYRRHNSPSMSSPISIIIVSYIIPIEILIHMDANPEYIDRGRARTNYGGADNDRGITIV